MEALDKLIYNLLSSGEGVTLPGVGSLHVEPIKASLNGTTLTPASRRVKFSNRESASLRSILSVLFDDFALSGEEAEECYKEWLTAARRGAGLHIEGVGDISKSFFKPTEEFDQQALNPWRTSPLKLRRRTSPLPLIFIGCLILGAAGAWLYIVHGEELLARWEQKRIARAEQSVEVKSPTDNVAPIVNEEVVEEEQGSKPSEISASEEPSKEITATEVDSNPSATSMQPDQAENKASATTSVEQPKPATPATHNNLASAGNSAQNRAATSATQSTSATTPSPIAITPAEATEGKWFVVAGVYSTDTNAERFIAADELGVGRGAYTKHPFTGGKILVAVGVYDTSEEAAARRRELSSRNSSIWTWHR